MEYWDIYDINGLKTDKVKSSCETMLNGEYHLAVEVWIVNSQSKILLQKRSKNCDVLPEIWGLTTGKVLAGESSTFGCIREVKEELSLDISHDNIIFVRRIFRTDMIWDVYFVKREVELNSLKLQHDEVSEVKFVSNSEFIHMLKDGEIFEYPEIYEILDECSKIALQK